MESTIPVLLQDHKNLVAIAMYHSLNADCRVGNRFTGPQHNKNAAYTDNDDATAQANVDTTLLMNIIQAEAHQDDTTVLKKFAEQQNSMPVVATLADVMCDDDLPVNIVGQAPFPPLLVNSVMINKRNRADMSEPLSSSHQVHLKCLWSLTTTLQFICHNYYYNQAMII
jgi:hypothetical protein